MSVSLDRLSGFRKRAAIVHARIPGIEQNLAIETVRFVQAVRRMDLAKPPGVAETLDCLQALQSLGTGRLDAESAEATLGYIAKSADDAALIRSTGIEKVLSR